MEHTIKSFKEYIQYTEKYRGNSYFRGQADASWDITPSISRHDSTVLSINDELELVKNRILKGNEKLPFLQIPKHLATLFRMQHYGDKTRICDLTTSNLSALLFATIEHWSKDGSVFIIDNSSAVNANGKEMQLFSKVISGEYDLATFQNEIDQYRDVITILTSNYIVKHKEMLFNNSRSFRQGGTGIVFGFGYKDWELTLTGNSDISNVIREKIIIPCHVKEEMVHELKKLGFTKEFLYDESDGFQSEEITLLQIDFTIREGFDSKGKFYKITGKYLVSTIYYEDGDLAIKVSGLHKMLFSKYGDNARIWTLFYYDENDLAINNWLCRSQWKKDVGYELIWSKDYRTRRQFYMNSKVSNDDVIRLVTELIEEVMPYYNDLKKCTENPDYDFNELLELATSMQSKLNKINMKAGDLPASDYNTQKLIESAQLFICDVSNIADHTIMHSNYENQTDGARKHGLRWNFSKCNKSLRGYFVAKDVIVKGLNL